MRHIAPMLAALLTAATALADGPGRPDVVLFLADDLGWADCSIHGGRGVPTPNMARLAAAGMTFTHAFVASPSCAPSRAALLSGLSPMRNGAMANHAKPRPGVKLWPAYFRELGYEVVAIGKVGHYAHVTGYGFDHVSHYKYHQDDCIAAAVAWLAARRSSKPLCLLVGTNWPHVPWPAETTIAADRLALPPIYPDTAELRSAFARYLQAVALADRDLGQTLDAARRHLGSDTPFVFTSDHGPQLPFGKWNCYDGGVRVPLVVAWPGRVRPGSTSDALVSWTDLLPTVLEMVGGRAPEALDGRSFAAVCRGETAGHRDRIFLTHSSDGGHAMNCYPIRAVRTRHWKYIRNLDPGAEFHSHIDRGKSGSDGRDYWDACVAAAKTDPALAAFVGRYHTRPADELYDMTADPWETTNLAGEVSRAATLRELRAALDQWMAEQGDTGMGTERALHGAKPVNVKPR